MTSFNQIIDINNDKYLLRKTLKKLVLHHLPSLDIVHKYYSQVDYFSVNKLQIMLIYKNVLTFLKPKCPPLRLIQYQQQYLDWQPIGGLSMCNMTILYDKSTIGFYYRNPKLQKSWEIDVIQEIQQVKSSQDQKFIALKVKQPKNTIFIWNMDNINKKPNQQIQLNQQIMKWEFFGKNIILIMTVSQFKIYFVNPQTNLHYIQYYISLPQAYHSFFMINDFNQTSVQTGRKSVNNLVLFKQNSCRFDVVELYDIEKRHKSFKHSEFKKLIFQKQITNNIVLSNSIAGYQYEGKLLFLAQTSNGNGIYEPRCLVMGQNYSLQRITQYKQHLGNDLQNIQSMNDYILFLSKKENIFKLAKFISHDGSKNIRGSSNKIKFIKQYPSQLIEKAILTQKNVLIINKQKRLIIENIDTIQNELSINSDLNKKTQPISTDFSKYNPKLSYYIFENKVGIFFVSGIRYFKYDFKKNEVINVGFVLKNQRAKLHEVRISTSSLVYKINNQFVLIEYSSSDGQKMVFRTIKSTQSDKIISLRKDKWATMNLKEIVLGQGQNQLASFNLQKMYKTLLQDNSYFEYDLFWTTHGGMILALKNYLFFLQVIENQNGYEIHLIKKGHSYLHRRFSSSVNTIDRIKVVDPRNLVVYTGNRIVKLCTNIQHYITQNPYDIPDTLLNRQLKMRQYFPPHHPSIINSMLQNGWFTQIIKLMQKILNWIQQQRNNLKDLYRAISIQDYYVWKQQNKPSEQINQEFNIQDFNDQVVTVKTVQNRNQPNDIQLLNKLCQLIINNPVKILLSQNSPLVLQNILKSIIFYLQNSRQFDYYSQSTVTKTKLQSNKNKPFTTMQVAFLKHSINKDQALQFLKQPNHKMQWAWIQKYSIALWYDQSIQKWKKWIQEIAMTQFRIQKDPFDCLFWYILINKKGLLVTLFKAQKFSSKEHDSMHTFLQRDFQDPKHKSAALKNAYALLDKKRYMHAMAFFLLADKKQECIRFAIDRLFDLNLAYVIHLLCYNQNQNQQNLISKNLIEKGDIWAQHIGWVQQKKHIASYNVLLKQQHSIKWQYSPCLKGYHPSVIQFAMKIKQSLAFKRQLQTKNNQLKELGLSTNFDHLNFSQSQNYQNQTQSFQNQQQMKQKQSNQQIVQQKSQKKQPTFYNDHLQLFDLLPEEQQNGFRRQLNQKAIRYYMRYHFPCLALTLKPSQQNKYLKFDAQRAYQLEKYILTGQLSQSVVQIAQGLDDIMGILKNSINTNNNDLFLQHLTYFRQNFQSILKKIKINQLNPPAKHQVGQILHYSYFSQKILIESYKQGKRDTKIQNQFNTLTKINNFGKIIVGILLKIYFQMAKNLQGFKQSMFFQANQQFWKLSRQRYDTMLERKKEKNQKLMDSFQLSLNMHIKKVRQDEHFDFSIRMCKSSTINIVLWRKVFQFLQKGDNYLKQKIQQLKVRLDKIINYWVEKEYIKQIQDQIYILIKQGSQYRLKLNVLTNEFKQKQLDTIEELLKIIYTSRQLKEIQEKRKNQQLLQKNELMHKNTKQLKSNIDQLEQKTAVQIFKNKTEPIKSFILNKNQGKGLEVVVLFKKSIRKFQALENLANRDRTKDGISLIHQDNAYLSQSYEAEQIKSIMNKFHLPKIQNSLKNIIQSRKNYDQQGLVKRSDKYSNHLQDYLKALQSVPHLQSMQINSIESHHSLPIFFLGTRGAIQICRFDENKNFNRILCPGLTEIIKMFSIGQRIYALDKQGNIAAYLFDHKYSTKVVFQVKKEGIIDFTCPTASQIGFITLNSFQMYDTLLHPKRQAIFKIQMSTAPVGISHLSQNEIVVLRRNEIQIYDVVKNQLIETYNCQIRARSIFVERGQSQNSCGKIFIGRYDCRIKVIDLGRKSQKIIKVGNLQDQKDKIFIQSIKSFGNSYFCLRTDGSIYFFDND